MHIPRNFRHCGHNTTKSCSVLAKYTLALNQSFLSSGLYIRLKRRGEGRVDWLSSCGADASNRQCKAWFTNTMTSLVKLWRLSITQISHHLWLFHLKQLTSLAVSWEIPQKRSPAFNECYTDFTSAEITGAEVWPAGNPIRALTTHTYRSWSLSKSIDACI